MLPWMRSKRVLSGNKSPPVTDSSPYLFGQADVVSRDSHFRGSLKITFLSKWDLEIGIIHVTSHLHFISSEIAKSFAQAVHFNTFGGNPIASAVGKAVLEVYIQYPLITLQLNLKIGFCVRWFFIDSVIGWICYWLPRDRSKGRLWWGK